MDDAAIGAGAERRYNKRMRKRDEMEAGHRSFQLDPNEKTVDSLLSGPCCILPGAEHDLQLDSLWQIKLNIRGTVMAVCLTVA
jgi:hypothetical protein